MGKLKIPDNVAQRCLNQISGKRTYGIYNKDAYFEERTEAHATLCDWLAPIVNGSTVNDNASCDLV